MRLVGLLSLVLWALGLAACASSNALPRPFPAAGGSTPQAAAAPAGDAAGILDTALALRGTPYRTGGRTPDGFDCSGYVWYVFEQHGVALPRTVESQFQVGRRVDRSHLRPGDLVFFDTSGSPASHVGILVGVDEFVHAPNARGVVRIERLSSAYWSRRFVGGRRLL